MENMRREEAESQRQDLVSMGSTTKRNSRSPVITRYPFSFEVIR